MDTGSSARNRWGLDLVVLALATLLASASAGCGLFDDPFAGGSHDPPREWKGCALEFCREDDAGYHCFYSDSQCFHWTSWDGEGWQGSDWACSF